MRIVEMGKPIMVFDSLVFYDPCQITGLSSFVLLTSFYKICEIFLYITFIVFALLHIGLILLYQFVNLLERFGKRILYSNLLRN